MKRNCKHCSIEFDGKQAQKFCTVMCRALRAAAEGRKVLPIKRRPKVTKTCAHCEASFQDYENNTKQHCSPKCRMLAKHADWATLYKEGQTLEQIGAVAGVTRERVRQVLKIMGLTWQDGGQHQRVKQKREAKNRALDEKYLRKTGMRRAQYREVAQVHTGKHYNTNKSGDNPQSMYRSWKANKQKYHKGEFKLSFAEWWGLWQQSGKWKRAGLGRNKYCMVVRELDKPIDINNVYIDTLKNTVKMTRRREQEQGRRRGAV